MKISGLMLFPLFIGFALVTFNWILISSTTSQSAFPIQALLVAAGTVIAIVGTALLAGLNLFGVGGNPTTSYFTGMLSGAVFLWIGIAIAGAFDLLNQLPYSLGVVFYIILTVMYFIGIYDMLAFGGEGG